MGEPKDGLIKAYNGYSDAMHKKKVFQSILLNAVQMKLFQGQVTDAPHSGIKY